MSPDDLELLGRYAQENAETAFEEIVRRYLDLVFSAALRQVRSRELAEEVAQSVFVDLARQGHRLSADTFLSAWLYQVTRRTAIDVIRREARRKSRERIAAEMNTFNATTNVWAHVESLLEEAMDALDEKDRLAVLLRYFEDKPLREVGQKLGVSEDTARKRVDRAVERLREFLGRRGVAVEAGGLAAAITANAIQVAPPGLLKSIITGAAAMRLAAASSSLIMGTKIMAMPLLQKMLITAAIIVTGGVALYEARQISVVHSENQRLRRAQALSIQEIEQLQRERDDAANRAIAALADADRMRQDYAHIVKLREQLQLATTEVRKLQAGSSNANDEIKDEVTGWIERAKVFKQWFSNHPDKSIPELRLLWSQDWLVEARQNPTIATNASEGNTIEMIASAIRQRAKSRFAGILGHALGLYVADHAGELPGSLEQLLFYVPAAGDKPITQNPAASAEPVDASMLARYELRFSGPLGNVPREEPIVMEKQPVDLQVDSLLRIKANGYYYQSVGLIDNMAAQLQPWITEDFARLQPFLR